MGSSGVSSRLGSRFGPYELQSVIGIGGMGEVYRAYDTVRERMVALKVLRPDVAADPVFQDRFRRESRIAARLQEPHVIPVHDFGEIDGALFIDMRLVEGSSVKEELRRHGSLPPGRAVSIVGQVASALDAAHANGLVHRDIKPENVLLTTEDFAYLVDFGIAHGGGEATVTKTGLVIGSAAYMAPERLNGEPGGPPSDVYSLACLLFESLTGRAPFEAGDLRQVMSAHLFSPPPRPSIMRRGVPAAFDDVVARGMAKNPAERFGSAGELARAALVASSGRMAPVAPPVPPPVGPPPTRQFATPDPRPAYASHPSLPVTPPATRKAGLSRTQKALLLGTFAMFALAAVLAAVVVASGGGSDDSPARTPLAVPPSTAPSAAPTTTSEETTTSTSPSTTSSTTTSTSPSTTTSPTTSGAPIAGVSGADAQGFVGHSARCDAGTSPAAMIRTANSLAIVCETGSDSYYYRGERLSDGAQLRLENATPAGGGYDVVNPADGSRYQVRPDQLTISSSRGSESDPALEYGAR